MSAGDWRDVRDGLVRACMAENPDRGEIASWAETLDIMLNPGEFEDIEASRAEIARGELIDGPTALAPFLSRAQAEIEAGDVGEPAADVFAELDAERRPLQARGFWEQLRAALFRTTPAFNPSSGAIASRGDDASDLRAIATAIEQARVNGKSWSAIRAVIAATRHLEEGERS